MYTKNEILQLAEDYDNSTYGDLRREGKRQSFLSQMNYLIDESASPDAALEQFLKTVYDRFFIMENMKVYFGPYEDLPLYINQVDYDIVLRWRFKINK